MLFPPCLNCATRLPALLSDWKFALPLIIHVPAGTLTDANCFSVPAGTLTFPPLSAHLVLPIGDKSLFNEVK